MYDVSIIFVLFTVSFVDLGPLPGMRRNYYFWRAMCTLQARCQLTDWNDAFLSLPPNIIEINIACCVILPIYCVYVFLHCMYE